MEFKDETHESSQDSERRRINRRNDRGNTALADPPQGGYGPGYGMGPGMMGSYGQGYGMGPGTMGSFGPDYGMGTGMMGGYATRSDLNLSGRATQQDCQDPERRAAQTLGNYGQDAG